MTNWRFRLMLSVGLGIAGCNPCPAWAEKWVATGYDACMSCCGKTDGITASGKRARADHTVACNWLPFGTRIRINGRVYTVEDRGAVSHFGSKKSPKRRLDIYFETHQEALNWGKRSVEVERVIGAP